MNMMNEITTQRVAFATESNQLAENWKSLHEHLTQQQRVLLLRIIDEKDLLIETAAYDNYENGFCEGMQLAFQIHNFSEEKLSKYFK